jgi:CRP-like cAMP-binding protein
VLAEASLFSSRYHCTAVAEGAARVARIGRRRIEVLQREDPGWLIEWTALLATEVQRARARAEILSHRTVAQRLDAWQALHSAEFPPKGRWLGLAAEIGTTPEALYRELARRRERA